MGESSLPAGVAWLTDREANRAAGMRYPKRRSEYLLRRFAAKSAVSLSLGRPTDPESLAGIDVANAPTGAPYVLVDATPLGQTVSLTDRAGWAVCVLGGEVGCDLELVEPRSPGFVRDFLTAAEQTYVGSQAPGPERDAAANLLWSAKESALKVLRTGLRRDTRSVEVTVEPPDADGWGALVVRSTEGRVFPGWWRRDGVFLLTVTADGAGPKPVPLADPQVLAAAVPVHSWLGRPLHP